MSFYVCSGAKMKCSMGSQQSALNVLHPVKPVRVEGNPVAAMLDHKPLLNIKPFGQCKSLANPAVAAATAAANGKLQPMPCIPNTVTPWMGAKMNVRVKGNPALLDSSKLLCMWAGVIEITNPGQKIMKEGGTPLNFCSDSVLSEKKAKGVDIVAGNPLEHDEVDELTVKDFAEILERIEGKKKCYESARHYAAYHVDYWKLTKLARLYVDETDAQKKEKEKDNDPNLMPSRFMILYGADDDKLRGNGNIDEHHDNFEGQPDHEVSVANLRKALILLGYDVEESGPFDEQLFDMFLRYLSRYGRVELESVREDGDDADKPLDVVAHKYGAATWKYLYDEEGGDGDGSVDHEKIVKKLDSTYGDGLLKEKGGVPHDYRSSICYHYPWVPFSLTVNMGEDYQEKDDATYEIYDRRTMTLLGEGPFRKPYKIECLLPDSQDVVVAADGEVILLNPEQPVMHLSEEYLDDGEDTEKRIVDAYLCYGEDQQRVTTDDSRHYVDLSLHIVTKNYYDGETVSVILRVDDGEPSHTPSEREVSGIVNNNNAVIENMFKDHFIL